MYQNILIPVSLDEERHPEISIQVAKSLAAPGARITFFHVIEQLPAYVADHVPPAVWEDRKIAAKKRLDELSGEVSGAEAHIIVGSPGRAITDWASDKGADLIVIASHVPRVSDIFLGSTAAWVVRHADCSVHVIR